MNRTIRLALGMFPVLLLGCEPRHDAGPNTSDFDAIQGTWKYVSHMSNGHPSQDHIGCYQTFRGNKVGRTWIAGESADSIVPIFEFELNPDTSPKQIDVLMVGGRMHGLYSIKDDTLMLCYPWSGDQGRPQHINTIAGDGNVVHILERVSD